MIYGVFPVYLVQGKTTTIFRKACEKFVKRGIPVFSNFACKGLL